MVPLITFEIALCEYVCEFVSGINVFEFDFGVQVDSVKKPIKRNFVGCGNMSHCRASAFDDHLDQRFIIFKNEKHSTRVRRLHV